MVITVGPAYFLSILWLKLPLSMHILADISGVMQLLILLYFVKIFLLIKKNILDKLTAATKYLWAMVFIAFIIKIILQMLSVIPFFSGYAFGFRPIVIGYLHLSFLGIISFFILGYIFQLLSEGHRRFSKPGVFIFVTGVLLQEIVLMMQGFEVIEFERLPHADIILFCSSIVMGLGLIWITFTIGQPGRSKETTGIV